MQQIYHAGCDWTTAGQMYLHQRQYVLINSLDIGPTNLTFGIVSKIGIPACTQVTIPTRNLGQLRTPVS